MFGLFKASNPPTFGDVIWKLILRIVAGIFLICAIPYVVMLLAFAMRAAMAGIFGI